MTSLFRPDRTALGRDVIAACAERSPGHAWEHLIGLGLLPSCWRDAPQRRFSSLGGLSSSERAQRRRSAPYLPTAAHPDDGTECAVIASMWPAMEAAEAHARAFVTAAAHWGTPQPSTILWMPIAPEGYGYHIHDTKPGVWEPDAIVWRIFPSAAADLREGVLGSWILGEERWRAGAERDPRVRERPSPFTPALALFACGFGILPSSTDVLVLAYPSDPF
jgi:hypothetical protein